jgi:hypothetical protein
MTIVCNEGALRRPAEQLVTPLFGGVIHSRPSEGADEIGDATASRTKRHRLKTPRQIIPHDASSISAEDDVVSNVMVRKQSVTKKCWYEKYVEMFAKSYSVVCSKFDCLNVVDIVNIPTIKSRR